MRKIDFVTFCNRLVQLMDEAGIKDKVVIYNSDIFQHALRSYFTIKDYEIPTTTDIELPDFLVYEARLVFKSRPPGTVT